MNYLDQDYADIMAYCEAVCTKEPAEVAVTYLPPQKTPRWARQYTARPVGTRLGNGNYMRLGTQGAE